jgi:hypothetical protein
LTFKIKELTRVGLSIAVVWISSEILQNVNPKKIKKRCLYYSEFCKLPGGRNTNGLNLFKIILFDLITLNDTDRVSGF